MGGSTVLLLLLLLLQVLILFTINYCDYDNNVDLIMLLTVNSYNERNN